CAKPIVSLINPDYLRQKPGRHTFRTTLSKEAKIGRLTHGRSFSVSGTCNKDAELREFCLLDAEAPKFFYRLNALSKRRMSRHRPAAFRRPTYRRLSRGRL